MAARPTASVGSAPPSRVATVDAAVFTLVDGRLHVLVRGGARHTLPWGPASAAESLEATARRVIKDAVPRGPLWFEQAGASSEGQHPGGRPIVSVCYAGAIPWREAPAGWLWAPVNRCEDLPERQHRLFEGAMNVVRTRSESAPVAFRLLPKHFTLSELQQAYEALLGRRLHKASFRRALHAAWLVEPLDEWRSEGRGRPAQLFRYVPRRRGTGRRGVRFEVG